MLLKYQFETYRVWVWVSHVSYLFDTVIHNIFPEGKFHVTNLKQQSKRLFLS